MKRKLLRTAAALLAAVLLVPVHAGALSAKSAAMLDCLSGRMLLDRNSTEPSLIASTTKIMTALLICENCNVLDQMSIPKQAVGVEGSSMYLREGEKLSLQELLYGLMLSSGNDAAVALALYCCGSIPEFANLMNDKAQRLGMTQSHFENPNGLDAENHRSTARDLAILASSATQNHRRLVAVTINDPNDWQDHAAMLNQGFSQFNLQRIVTVGDCVGYREIAGGKPEKVAVLAAENFVYAISAEEQPQLLLPGTGFIYAPVVQGAEAGVAYVLLSGKAVGKIPVVYGETAEISQPEQKKPRFLFWRMQKS